MKRFSLHTDIFKGLLLLMLFSTFSSCASIDTQTLTGEWHLAKASIDQTSILSKDLTGSKFSISFDDTGRAQGQTACNRWSSTYQQEGSMLKLGPVAMTKMRCVHKNDQQKIVNKHFPRALSELAKANIDGDKLTLSWPNGDEWELYRTPL